MTDKIKEKKIGRLLRNRGMFRNCDVSIMFDQSGKIIIVEVKTGIIDGQEVRAYTADNIADAVDLVKKILLEHKGVIANG